MTKSVLVALVGLAIAPAAMAQWSDNFDSYALGTINGQGGWQGWDNTPAAAGIVTNAITRGGSPRSQMVNTGTDSVHTYTGVTSGQWTYTAWQYIPTSFTGNNYFILMNQYTAAPRSWAVQMLFDGTTNLVTDANGRASNPINFVRGQWAEIRVDFDLNANTITEYYNGAVLATGTWAAGGPVALDAVDLYNEGTTVFYDDMSLVPAPASIALLGLGGLIVGRRRR